MTLIIVGGAADKEEIAGGETGAMSLGAKSVEAVLIVWTMRRERKDNCVLGKDQKL